MREKPGELSLAWTAEGGCPHVACGGPLLDCGLNYVDDIVPDGVKHQVAD
jgi:hypothetical protein